MDKVQNKRLVLICGKLKEVEEFEKSFSKFFDVIHFLNAKEALKFLKKDKKVSCVSTDLRYATKDDYNLIKFMKKDNDLYFIPSVAVVMTNDLEAESKAFNCGAFDVFFHPLSLNNLATHMYNVVSRGEETRSLDEELIKNKTIGLLYRDPLTGILNITGFCAITSEVLKTYPKKTFYLVRWDISRFKVYNDLFGMSKGDELLKAIANSLSKGMTRRKGLYACGHISGDHFVFLVDKDKFNADALYEKINKEVNGLSPEFALTIKMGIYVINNSTDDVLVMTDRALLALKSIKQDYNVNYAFFDSSMRNNLLKEERYLHDMKSAIQENQFVVYYQPQVRYDLNELYGAEALVRWKHPELGFISPGEFIPLFERSGFISELDEYVWDKVAGQIEDWLEKGYKVPSISVNVSRIHLKNPNLVKIINDILAKHHVSQKCVRLEVTESSYREDAQNLIQMVNKLRDAGYTVEMDDFGSGYSSLNSLKDVDVNAIKLDLKFLKSAKQNKKTGNIISSVVRLAHTIDLPVIAEGVETVEQAEYLKSVDCLIMQGFLFAKALPSNEFEDYLKGSKVLINDENHWEAYSEGVDDLLNADTQSTLIFNSYVGGAGIIELAHDQVVALRLNDRFFEVLGVKRTDYRSRQNHILDGFRKDTREDYLDMLNEAIKTKKEASSVTCSVGLIDGKEVWIQNTVRCLGKKVNDYIFYLSVENITELRDTKKLYDSIIGNIPGGLAVFEVGSKSFKRIYTSDGAKHILGYGKDEPIPQEIGGLISRVLEQDRPKLLHDIDETIKKHGVFNCDMRVFGADKNVHWVNLIANPIKINDSYVYYGIYSDVTNRKNEENEKNKANVELNDILDNSPVGLATSIITDYVKLDYTSQSFLSLIGYTREEIKTLFNDDFGKLIDKEKTPEYDNYVAETKGIFDFVARKLTLKRKDGTDLEVLSISKVKHLDKKTTFGYSILLDISDKSILNLLK